MVRFDLSKVYFEFKLKQIYEVVKKDKIKRMDIQVNLKEKLGINLKYGLRNQRVR